MIPDTRCALPMALAWADAVLPARTSARAARTPMTEHSRPIHR